MIRPDIINIALIVFATSFFLSRFFYKKNFKFGSKEISTFGGVVIFMVMLLGLLISGFRSDFHAWRIFLPFSLMFLLGFLDDYKHLSPLPKLFFQILIVILALIMGLKTEIIYVNIYINYLITLVWVLLITNAFNFLDIMDGLCIGNILFVSLTFAIIAFVKFQPLNLFFPLLVFAASLGFFPFNYKKAHAYLGDSGSLSIGALFALLAISFDYAREDNPHVLFTPLIILGLPLFDFTYVTLRRILQKKSILKKSPDHLAILMKNNNVPQEKIIFRFWFVSLGFLASALILQFGPYFLGIAALLFALILFSAIGFKYYK